MEQNFDEIKQEQIYLSGGLGTKINLGDRVTLNLEGKVHAFNLDPANMLRIDNPEGDSFNDWIDNNITDERMMNWSLNAGIQFYLGGKNPSNYTARDRAYERQFSNGFSGLRFVLEPGGAYIDFDDDINLRNTYLLGGALGNLIDRIRFGAVIDFLDFHIGALRWPAFNIADICIVVGVGLYLLNIYIARRKCINKTKIYNNLFVKCNNF